MKTNKKQYLSKAEAAEETGLSRATIDRAIAARQLAASKMGARVIIPRRAIEEWIEANLRPAKHSN